MSTISASTTTTTAYKVTADTTGTLVLQTGSSPTTAVTISSAQIVTFANPPVANGAGSVSSNTVFGSGSLTSNTTGNNNSVFGQASLSTNTTGAQNTAIGQGVLYYSNANYNTGVGGAALQNNTSGASNTGIGQSALFNNTTASYNTVLGYQAGYTQTTGGGNNTYIGVQAGYVATGSYNTFLGVAAGGAITTGSKNTIVGVYNGNQNGVDIRTATNCVILSDGDGFPVGSATYSGGGYSWQLRCGAGGGRMIVSDGSQFYPNPDNTILLGYPTYRWTTVYATTGTINTSDENQKQDIATLDDAEKRAAAAIKALIKKYRFKDAVEKKGDEARIHIGAVAQEVAAAFVAEGLDPARYALFCSDTWYEVDGNAGDPTNPYTAETEGAVEVTRLGLRYDELLAFVIAAM